MRYLRPAEGFEWRADKDAENRRKHRIGFGTACKIWSGTVLEGPDDREDYGEERLIAYGVIDNRVVVVVYTWRGDKRRIISARKATSDERETYYATLKAHGIGDED